MVLSLYDASRGRGPYKAASGFTFYPVRSLLGTTSIGRKAGTSVVFAIDWRASPPSLALHGLVRSCANSRGEMLYSICPTTSPPFKIPGQPHQAPHAC
ncbi:MAG: hypothetical protein QOJ42_2828 [Acidobacteriaceae bacterium]|jgi:hypothetical protein|nr:hypothetical protein [Acidobacteriaceae bacterium]